MAQKKDFTKRSPAETAKTTLSQEAARSWYFQSVTLKYTGNRLTDLAEMGRLFEFFTGSKKGKSEWLTFLKKTFPEARSEGRDGRPRYDFDADRIWDLVQENPAWVKVLERQRIRDFWELSAKIDYGRLK